MTDTKIRVIRQSNDFESLSEVWDSLLRKSGDSNTIYLTHEWLLTWWKHFGEGRKLNVVLIEKEGQPIAVFPLMRTEYRIGLFKIHVMDTIGSLNCNHVGVISAGNGEKAVSAFLSYLKEELAKGESMLRVVWVPDDCEFLDLLRRRASLPTSGLIMQEKVKTLAPYITLPATWDEYFRSLSTSRRHVLRRKLRSLEKAHNVEFRECAGDNFESMFSRFVDLHERRWQSAHVKGVFSEPRMEGFYWDIATQFDKRGWLYFSCMIMDGELVSAEYSFIYNRKFYCVTSARDIAYAKYDLGHLHQMFQIKYAVERGLREFDFLRGDEPYKFHWTKSYRRYINFVIARKGFRSGLRVKLILAFLRLREVRQYSLKEIYYIYLTRRREARQRKEMGLKQ